MKSLIISEQQSWFLIDLCVKGENQLLTRLDFFLSVQEGNYSISLLFPDIFLHTACTDLKKSSPFFFSNVIKLSEGLQIVKGIVNRQTCTHTFVLNKPHFS